MQVNRLQIQDLRRTRDLPPRLENLINGFI
jgi:hypothetical protein